VTENKLYVTSEALFAAGMLQICSSLISLYC